MGFFFKTHNEKMKEMQDKRNVLHERRIEAEMEGQLGAEISKEKSLIAKASGQSMAGSWKGSLKQNLQKAGKLANEFEQNQHKQEKRRKKDPFDSGLFEM